MKFKVIHQVELGFHVICCGISSSMSFLSWNYQFHINITSIFISSSISNIPFKWSSAYNPQQNTEMPSVIYIHIIIHNNIYLTYSSDHWYSKIYTKKGIRYHTLGRWIEIILYYSYQLQIPPHDLACEKNNLQPHLRGYVHGV